jgi:hypothetical protein
MKLGFVDGIRIFSRAFARTWIEPELRRWYFKTLALTLLLALGVVFGLFALGTGFFATQLQETWSKGVAIVLWTLAIMYLGGRIALLLVSTFVLLVGGDSALSNFYFRDLVAPPSKEMSESVRLRFKDHSLEVLSMLKSLGIALVAWPLFLVPLLMPVGVLVFAWAMAGDVLAVGRRLCHSHGFDALEDGVKISAGAKMGLAVLPSSMALFPIVGWVLLPMLQGAGLELQLLTQIRKREKDDSKI